MFDKLKAILGSIRFWIVSLTAITAVLEQVTTGTLTISYVFDTVQVWLVAVVGIGTLDSVAQKFGASTSKKK